MAVTPSYRYAVSLRIRHPTWPAVKVSEILGLVPDRTWDVGAPRQTARGMPLEGTNADSYWTHSFGTFEDANLEGYLDSTLDDLSTKAGAFGLIAETGGTAELFVGLFLEQWNTGYSISAGMHQRLASLGLALSIDIYSFDGESSEVSKSVAGEQS